MKKMQRKICILLAAAVTLSCSNFVLAQDDYNEIIPQIALANEQIIKDNHNDILNVRIPCDISFKITLLEGTDTGWVSSDDFSLENCGSNDVIVKFEFCYGNTVHKITFLPKTFYNYTNMKITFLLQNYQMLK